MPALETRTSRPSDGDPSWSLLYRVGGICAGVAVVLYGAALVIVAVSSTPPVSGGAELLEYIAAHRSLYIVRQLLWLSPSVFLMVAFLAVAMALRRQGRSLAAIAGLVGVTSWALSLAWPTTGDGSLALVLLSDKYAAAAGAARAPFTAGAELLIALNDVPAAIGVLQTVGVLLISLLMLRGTLSTRLAWLGVATGTIGIVAEALRPVLGWAYATYGLLLFAWLAWLAVALWNLASRASKVAMTATTR